MTEKSWFDEMSEASQWIMTQIDERFPLLDGVTPCPVLTVALFKICDNDEAKFDLFNEYIERAYNAGKASTFLRNNHENC